MKKLTIKLKITLWYSAAMTLLLVLLFWLIYGIALRSSERNAKESLMNAAETVVSEISYEDGYLDIDDDVDFLSRGIYISVYDLSAELIEGRTPDRVELPETFSENLREIDGFYIYDLLSNVENYGSVWIRTIAETGRHSGEYRNLLNISLVFFPLAIALIAFIGYRIVFRAFRPIAHIAETANEIERSGDLSRRIKTDLAKGEVKELAESFDRMLVKLESSFENEKRFTSDASHELRTPAAVISAECEYALKNPDAAHDSLITIKKESDRLTQLISALLLLARADSGRQKLDFEDINLSELFLATAEEADERFNDKNIRLHSKIDEDIYMKADETLILRMLMNLISNAYKYGRENGNICLKLGISGDNIIGIVQDDGIGIPDSELEKVFERFYRSDSSRSTQGHGLGLPIVKWIAEAHGGSIILSNKNGTEFCFIFPNKKNSEN